MSSCKRFVFLAWACLVMPMVLLAEGDQSEPVGAGLEVVEKSRHSEILIAKNVDWNAYTAVRLDRATIEFRKNWIRDQRQRSGIIIREDDERRIKDSLADLFEKTLSRELTRQVGFVMTEEDGPGVMHITPRIVDLDVVAPDRARDNIGSSFTDSQGRMTVMLEIQDSSSGELLATTRHFVEDWYKGYMEWTTSATNHRAFRLMLERWADDLCEWLEEARAASVKTGTASPGG